jgi:hypothetical protein
MSKLSKALQSASVSGTAVLNVEDIFSTQLYTGDGSTDRDIVNGLNLSNEGGMIWFKTRGQVTDNSIFDTERGGNKRLIVNSTNDQYDSDWITFQDNGFKIRSSVTQVNSNNYTYVNWAFRKARKFFDVVTVTTSSSNTNLRISHSLGTTVGCIIGKRTDAAGDWVVWHNGLASATDSSLNLNLPSSVTTRTNTWGTSAPTSTDFGIDTTYFGTSATYVFYLFAHNDGDGNFGPTGDQDIIKCGSYTGNGTTNTVNLGFEPQWLLVKNTSTIASSETNWLIIDNMRQWAVDGNVSYLQANLNAVEGGNTFFNLTPTGFQPRSSNVRVNAIGENYIYIAIRRGGTDTPTSASEVFNTLLRTGNGVDTFLDQQILCDAVFTLCRSNTEPKVTSTRLFQNGNGLGLKTSTDVNSTLVGAGFNDWGYNNGWLVDSFYSETNTLNETYVNYAFKRSRGFFDIASYRGDGSSQLTAPHNLGVVPEMMLTKMYYLDSGAGSPSIRFFAYHKDLAATEGLWFDDDIAVRTSQQYWGSTRPTAENFYVGGSADNNINACKYINYLFASVPGVSKVGSYQGNDGTQAIDCGFSNGAQFVILKNITGIGDWVVVDSQRGITSGTDPFLEFNVTVQEQTDDCVSANSLGFNVIQSVSNTNINATGNTYIFYAIAAP